MLTSQRKNLILDALQRDGQVLAKPLSEAFGVSEDTVRRDLRELAAEGRLLASGDANGTIKVWEVGRP